jgi:uncharacterized protein
MPGRDLTQDEAARRSVLESAKVIAVVGRSDDPQTVSHSVGKYLMDAGFTVYSVNPTIAEIDGQRTYPDLASIPEPIDIVDVFRGSSHIPTIVQSAIAAGAKAVWVQQGIINDEARESALSAGLDYVQDMCIRTQHRGFFKRPESPQPS